MALGDLTEVVKRILQSDTLVFIALSMFTAMLLFVYISMSKTQSVLQQADRDQRICGTNVMEQETIRYIALQATQKSPVNFKWVLLSLVIASGALGALITIGAWLLPGLTTNTITQHILGITLVSVAATIIMVVYQINGWGNRTISITKELLQYKNDLKDACKVFQRASALSIFMAGDTYAPWVQYRNTIVKRIAQVNNLSDTKEAGDMFDAYIADLATLDQQGKLHESPILRYVEFHTQRDYPILRELASKQRSSTEPVVVQYIESDFIHEALDKLQHLTTYDPLAIYNARFSKVYRTLFAAMFVVVFAWLRIFSWLGTPAIIAAFVLVSVLLTIYSQV